MIVCASIIHHLYTHNLMTLIILHIILHTPLSSDKIPCMQEWSCKSPTIPPQHSMCIHMCINLYQENCIFSSGYPLSQRQGNMYIIYTRISIIIIHFVSNQQWLDSIRALIVTVNKSRRWIHYSTPHTPPNGRPAHNACCTINCIMGAK